MAHCKICGRLLKDKESIERGYGPICQHKRKIGQFQTELRFEPLIDRRLSMLEQYRIIKKLLE
ncbi:DUF6011 domain-containing protein [Sporomusa ovata]|uniref:DUF6011 domain-containing protein n=1 Tax=Sporomusa ovata TaxID=2378 RepID=UPI0004238B56|nr:DUF6011 domain-containing protein [Sporomusa ovata]